MSGTEVDGAGTAPVKERVHRNLWRILLIGVAVGMAVFAWHEPVVAVFGAAPVLIWCLGLARSKQTGLPVGVILLVPAVWILLPRDLGMSGQWLPSVFEVCVFWPVLAALVCALGPRDKVGCLPAVGLTTFVVAGIFTALLTVVNYAEGTTGDEGVWPGPSGLHAVELDGEGGSGGFNRRMEVSGDRAAERMRDYLDARGFKPSGSGLCQINGLVLTYKVCAGVKEITPSTVQVSWSI